MDQEKAKKRKLHKTILLVLVIYIFVGAIVAASIVLFGENYISTSVLTFAFVFLWPLLLLSSGEQYPLALFTVIFFSLLGIVFSRGGNNGNQNSSIFRSLKTRSGIVSIYMFCIIIVSIITLAAAFSKDGFARFDLMHVPFEKSFTYKDTLSCHVAYSTYHDIGELTFRRFADRNFVIRGLQTDSPQLEQAGFLYRLQKVQEGPAAIILTAAPAGTNSGDGYSSENIQIFKDQGVFARTFMDFKQYFGPREMFFPEGFQSVIAQKGRCE